MRSSQIQIAWVMHLQPSHMHEGWLTLSFHGVCQTCWVWLLPLHQRAQEEAPRFERHAIPAADDKPTDGPFPQPLHTPAPQELCGLGKGLRQGGHHATDTRYRGLNVHLPVDPQRRGGTDRARRVRQKRLLRLNTDVAPAPLEGIGDNLAILE